jgi:hypothetical protein
MGVRRVGRKVVGFVAVDKPLLDVLYHAAYHGTGDQGSAEEVTEYGYCTGSLERTLVAFEDVVEFLSVSATTFASMVVALGELV